MSSKFSDRRFLVRLHRSSRVECRAELEVPLSASAAWGQLRDFRRSASHDYFHSDIQVDGGVPRTGAGLVLVHRFLLFRVRRVGRILRWRESKEENAWSAAAGLPAKPAGFSFSDMSMTGPRVGFPHVFSYNVHAHSRASCHVQITVNGRWTFRGMPRWVARLWLAWVFGYVVVSVRNSLLAHAMTRYAI